MRFRYVVEVEAPNKSDAETVMRERLDPDEDYGFEYTVEWRYDSMIGSADEIMREVSQP